MSQVEAIPKTYEEAVAALAQWGSEAGPDDLRTFAAEDVGDNVVRIVHVSDDFPILSKVSAFIFGASEEFPFRSAIVLVRPEQWEEIRKGSGALSLPPGWKVERARQLWPPFNGATA